MRKLCALFSLGLLSLSLAGCANMTLQQGETYLIAAANLYCVLEPSTGKIVATLDPSTGVRKAVANADAAQLLLCRQAV